MEKADGARDELDAQYYTDVLFCRMHMVQGMLVTLYSSHCWLQTSAGHPQHYVHIKCITSSVRCLSKTGPVGRASLEGSHTKCLPLQTVTAIEYIGYSGSCSQCNTATDRE